MSTSLKRVPLSNNRPPPLFENPKLNDHFKLNGQSSK